MSTPQVPRTLKIEMADETSFKNDTPLGPGTIAPNLIDPRVSMLEVGGKVHPHPLDDKRMPAATFPADRPAPATIITPDDPEPRTRLQIAQELDECEKDIAVARAHVAEREVDAKRLGEELRVSCGGRRAKKS